ncbi:hypothetical protein TSL6_11040 [Sulfurovum sp. TSL6]|uniref:hypothetical protein n=1 Tax=Sulfurovum sp. TSL6 TaxID=2826995 RepID=UPI001CC3441D|nr:hypothetical protein [Sulfurovum sp. TSL6]GIU00598.1 hypothetical protein TSL6_11040 [Sulfurovum sp. TSL6]
MFLKKSSSESPVKNIVTLNAYTGKSYAFKNDLFKPLDKLTYNTSNFITSYVNNKDIISTTVHISRNIPEEDIGDILDIKAYEELGLDQATSYTISSIEVETSGEEREFHIFVAEPESLDEIYLPLKEETKYIDLIVPAPLLYKSLYKKEILQDNQAHCFVYFTQNDAFVTVYNNGQYLYSKSIEFSLEQIYDKYCESIGEKVDEKEFYTVLESEGLKTTNSDYQQNFMKIFAEVFITINDIIIYVKRAFELDSIDQMFIGSEKGPIIGLDDYSQNYLGLHSSDFNFNYNVTSEEWYTDQLQYLMLLSSFDYMEDESSLVNLTTYPRPPSFVNRASGQFIISTAAAITLSLAYPLVYLVGSYVNDAKIYALTIENNKLTAESNKYKKILSEKKSQIKVLDDKIKVLTDTYSGKTKTLTSIYDKKVNYRLKSGMFHTLAKELDQFEVNVDQLKSENDTVWLSLVSSDDRKFTEVIKYMSETHFDEIIGIDIERIQKDPASSYYKGLLKVELK